MISWRGKKKKYRYELLPVNNYKELGEYIYRNVGWPEINGVSLKKYVDFETIGKDYAKSVNGKFVPFGFEFAKETY